MSKLERHHLMFTRSSFNSSVEGKRLRENESLIPDIDAEAHNLLHRNCHPVPLMGFHALRRVNKLYIPDYDDPLKSIDNVCEAFEEAVKTPQSHGIERELSRLAVWSLEEQKQYVKYGLPSDQLYFDLGA